MMIYYGTKHLWKIVKTTDMDSVFEMSNDVRKYDVVPEQTGRYIYKVQGDSRKTMHLNRGTHGMCSDIAEELCVSKSNVCLLAILLSLKNSPTIHNNYVSIYDTFLSGLEDNIFNSLEQFLKEIVMWFSSSYEPIYNLYLPIFSTSIVKVTLSVFSSKVLPNTYPLPE